MNDKREMIRNAAIRLFARRGFHHTTTDRIADAAGVSVGTIYNYFDNKQDILDHIFLTERAKRQEVYEDIHGRSMHPMEKLRTLLETHFEEVQANPELVAVILREGHNVGERVREKEGLQRFLASIIAQGTESGMLRPVDSEDSAIVIFGAVRAIMRNFAERWEEGQTEPGKSDRTLEQLLDIMDNGLISR